MVLSSSDFKAKRKAKVGKRAPVKANVTDTSFTATSIHVSKQRKIDSSSTSRSNTTTNTTTTTTTTAIHDNINVLQEVLHHNHQQLQHPTIAVRFSALKHLKRTLLSLLVSLSSLSLSSTTTTTYDTTKKDNDTSSTIEQQQYHYYDRIIQSYATSIIHALLPLCCMEEDRSIRQFAIQVFHDVFYRCYNDNNNNNNKDDDDNNDVDESRNRNRRTIQKIIMTIPYILYEYIIAMIATSLNALHIQQQLDGTTMVQYCLDIVLSDYYYSYYYSTNSHTKEKQHNDTTRSSNSSMIDAATYYNTIHTAMIQFVPPLLRLLSIIPDTTTLMTSTTAAAATTKSTKNTIDSHNNNNNNKNQYNLFNSTTTSTNDASSDDNNTDETFVGDTNHQQQQQLSNIEDVSGSSIDQHPMIVMEQNIMMKKNTNNKKKRKRGISISQQQQQQQHRITAASSTFKLTNNTSTTTSKNQQLCNNQNNPKFVVLMAIYTIFRNYHHYFISQKKDDNDTFPIDNNNTSNNIIPMQQRNTVSFLFIQQQQQSSIQRNVACTTTSSSPSSSSSSSSAWHNYFPSLQQLGIQEKQHQQHKDDDNKTTTTTIAASAAAITDTRMTSMVLLTQNELLDLLVQIRNYIMEIMMIIPEQSSCSSSRFNSNGNGLYLNQGRQTTFLLCIQVVQYVLEYYNRYYNNCQMISSHNRLDDTTSIHNNRLIKLCQQIGTYILNVFSFYKSNHESMAQLSYTLLTLVDTLLPHVSSSSSSSSLASANMSNNNNKQKRTSSRNNNKSTNNDISHSIKSWIQIVVKHIESNFDDDIEVIRLFTSSSTATGVNLNDIDDFTNLSTSKEILLLFQQLLVRKELHSYFPQQRLRIVESFTNVFCNVPDHPLHIRLICSDVGRAAIVLCCHLISLQQYSIVNMHHFFGTINKGTTLQVLKSLAYYIVQYRGDFVYESSLCIYTLQQIVIRINDVQNSTNNTMPERVDVSNIYFTEFIPFLKMKMELLMSVGTSSEGSPCTIFEEYPEYIQRQVINFCIMSGVCTTSLIKHLAGICARCFSFNHSSIEQPISETKSMKNIVVSISMATFLVQSIHSIRKTIPMSLYIGFLIDSIGIMTLDMPIRAKQSHVVSLSFAVDQGIRIISSCLIASGTMKVLPMLEPLLLMVLSKVIRQPQIDSSVSSDILDIIRARAGLCLLAMFSMDTSSKRKYGDDKYHNTSIFHWTSSELKDAVVDGINFILSTGIIRDMGLFENEKLFNSWLSPIIALLVCEVNVLSRVIIGIIDTMEDYDSTGQVQILNVWLHIFNDSRIATILQVEGNTIMASIETSNSYIYAKETNNERSSIMYRLVNEIEIRCQYQHCLTKRSSVDRVKS